MPDSFGVSITDQRKAPAHFLETHPDFGYSHNMGNVVGTLIGGAIFAGLIWLMSELGWPWLWKGLAVVVFIAWPILTFESLKENSKLFRYYTWVYRSTKPVQGTIELQSQTSEAGICYTAKVITPERTYDCSVIPTNLLPRVESMTKEAKIFLHPDNGEPLLAEVGDMRVWVEVTT